MNSITAVIFFAVVAAASAGFLAPSGIVARSYAPALTAYSSPLINSYAAPIYPHAVSAYSAPLATGYLGRASHDTVVAGPSGTISTSKSFSAPALAHGYSALPAAYSYGGLYRFHVKFTEKTP